MARPAKPPKIVEVAQDSVPALSEPHFLIKVGDRYYLTLAVWEYSLNAPDITDEQRQGVKQIAEIFNKLAAKAVPAVVAPFARVATASQTGPGPGPRPH
jgi:hypothetical protein